MYILSFSTFSSRICVTLACLSLNEITARARLLMTEAQMMMILNMMMLMMLMMNTLYYDVYMMCT